MTTRTWARAFTQASDADFRAWIADLEDKMSQCGLVKVTAASQINLTTATRPATNVMAGYSIWRFNDALQSTAPIFIKIGYGAGSNGGATPRINVAVGSGTDGDVTLTGIFTTERPLFGVGGVTVNGTFTNYMCYEGGSFSFLFNTFSEGGGPLFGMSICRTCDGTGAWTGKGCALYTKTGTNSTASDKEPLTSSLRFDATQAAFSPAGAAGGVCIAPMNQTAQLSGNNPVYLHWMAVPEMVPSIGMCSHVAGHYTLGTFTAALVGTTQRTYLTMGTAAGGLGFGTSNSNSSSYAMAFLWE